MAEVRPAPAPLRTALSRERVLEAAIRLADGGGIGALSMRRLAHELGVEAMSLYHHFSNKDELLGAMLDAVYAEMELPVSGPDWRADLRACAISARDVLLGHEWATSIMGRPTIMISQAQFIWMNSVLGRLRAAGFSPNLTHHAYHALDSHIVGFVLWVLPYRAIVRERPGFAAEVMDAYSFDELPHLAEHIREHAEDRPGDVSEFEFGLDLILDGLERLRVSAWRTELGGPSTGATDTGLSKPTLD